MKREKTELAGLARLADAAFGAEQARMGALRRRESDIRGTIAALDAQRKARAASLSDADPALMAGADMLWHGWIDSRRSALNLELARNLADQAAARAALRRAFGRKQASEELVNRADASARLAAGRRSDRGF